MHKLILLILLLLVSCSKSKPSWHLGTDGNSDGVRDDIEMWINKSFISRPNVKEAMLRLAKIDPARCDYKFYTQCLEQVADDAIFLQVELFAKTLDTYERKEAFDQRILNCPKLDDRYINRKCNF